MNQPRETVAYPPHLATPKKKPGAPPLAVDSGGDTMFAVASAGAGAGSGARGAGAGSAGFWALTTAAAKRASNSRRKGATSASHRRVRNEGVSVLVTRAGVARVLDEGQGGP